jgi:hypothetical protein
LPRHDIHESRRHSGWGGDFATARSSAPLCRHSLAHGSLADQEALYRGWIAQFTDLPVEFTVIASQGSGRCLDREEYLRAIELVRTGEFDVVITEDLGRVCRRVIATRAKGERLARPELAEIEAMLRNGELNLLVVEDLGRLVRGVEVVRLCGIAVDFRTRVMAANDRIDTVESWEEDMIAACRDHVGHQEHTSKRLKHKLMNRFVKGVQLLLGWEIGPWRGSLEERLEILTASSPKELSHVRASPPLRC